jgi:uncharacterized protein
VALDEGAQAQVGCDVISRQSALPTTPSERLGFLDALRGLALLGVLAINLETEFRVSIFQQFLPAAPEDGINRWIGAALQIFVESKAFALFSLLFGVGLAIQFDRLAGTQGRAVLLVRRLLILLAFGLIHLFLIWNGEILTEYALAGLVVLPFLFGPIWTMVVGGVSFLSFYVLRPVLPPLVSFPDMAWLADHLRAANQVYATGSFQEILAFRIEEAPALLPLHLYVFPRTLGLFLIGAAAWRMGLLPRLGRFPEWLWATAVVVSGAGLGLTVFPSGSPVSAPLGTIVLAFGYALLVTAAAGTSNGRHALRWAEPVGRMAFTNYVLQSLVLGFIFYGYGLGRFGRLDLAAGLGLVLAVYTAQVLGSALWLGRFRYGPLEWLWRALMYGRAPPASRP